MSNRAEKTPNERLRKTTAALLAVSLTLVGILLIMLNGRLAPLDLHAWNWLHALPIGELGGTLFGAGLLGTLFEYSFRKDQDEANAERFRQIIHEQTPTMRDAVIEGFAIKPGDLKRVANPELLDSIATNVMTLRLGDEQFARELYEDIRDQAIRAPRALARCRGRPSRHRRARANLRPPIRRQRRQERVGVHRYDETRQGGIRKERRIARARVALIESNRADVLEEQLSDWMKARGP